MRIIILIALSSALVAQASVVPSESRVSHQNSEWEIYNHAWLVKVDDDDHVTYKRRPSADDQDTTTEKPCTTPIPTTTAAPPTTQRPRPSRPETRRVNWGESRTLDTSSSNWGRGVQPKSISRPTTTTVAPPSGNYWWMVSHRSDNSITYTRRSNNTSAETSTERVNPGQLRRLGHGDDSVVARVVNVGVDETEESVSNRGRKVHSGRKSGQSQRRQRVQQESLQARSLSSEDKSEVYPKVGEEHNGWRVIAKSKDQISWERVPEAGAANANLNLRSLDEDSDETAQSYISHNINTDEDADDDTPPRVGDVENGWRVIKKKKNHITWERVEAGGGSLISRTLISSGESQLHSAPTKTESQSTNTQSQFGVHETDSYPRVGDVVEGWRVMSKSSDHISWAKVGAEHESQNQRQRSNLQLRSGDQVQYRSQDGAERVFPRTRGGAAGDLDEEFPDQFTTYSRATSQHARHEEESVVGGTVRTSNSTNWNIGDELHGWKVIGKDYRGIIWEQMKNWTEPTEAPTTPRPKWQVRSGDGIRRRGSGRNTPTAAPSHPLHQINNGEFVRYLHPNGQEQLFARNREINNLQINSNLEGSAVKAESEHKKATDPKRIGWYLAKEARNSITWQKDDVEPNAPYNPHDFPQIGHEQTGWIVSNKTRHHISWRRVGTDHLGSDEVETQ